MDLEILEQSALVGTEQLEGKVGSHTEHIAFVEPISRNDYRM